MSSVEHDDRTVKPLTPGMRVLLRVAAVLVFLAGVQLFVFTERTERYFAWTIEPPLTAAFLGAAYWSSVTFEWAAAHRQRWAEARIAVPTVFVFTVLTLVVTLVHLDRFHLGAGFEPATRAVTWLWLAIYTVVPVLMAALVFVQRRTPGAEPARTIPRPPIWLAGLVAAQAVLLLALGTALLVVPASAGALWPWELSALTGRAIGAWLVSLGVAAAHALWERDLRRLRPAATAYVVFAILQGIALLRYPGTVDQGDPRTIGYVLFLASALVAGLTAMWLDRRAPSVSPEGRSRRHNGTAAARRRS